VKVTVYGNATCPYCGAARMLLTKKSIAYDDIVITNSADLRNEMQQRSGSNRVPQIFIGEHHVGGFDELCALEKSGELDKLLAG
jgi:glutaredoxin 3